MLASRLVTQARLRISPRFQGDNLDQNLRLVERIRAVADSLHASVAQVAIAWVAAQGQDIVPLVGARRRERWRNRWER